MRAWISAVLLVGLSLPLGFAQGRESDVESKIIALERIAKVQAYETKDLKTLDVMLDDEFSYVDAEGKLGNKTEFLAFVQATNSLQFVLEDMVVRLHGDTAIVTGLYRMKSVQGGNPILREGRFVDTWLNKNGHWVAIASLSTPVRD
jgi:ketosteroid isomerase-like protein